MTAARCASRLKFAFGVAIVITMAVLGGTTETNSATEALRVRTGFVSRHGTSFVLDGKPFRVAGANNHYLTTGSRAEVLAVLDDAQAMGANVIRTFIQPVIGSLDEISAPTIWDWHSAEDSSNLGPNGNYMLYWDAQRRAMAFNDGADGLERLDFLVAEAKKRDLRLIIAFMDFWAYMGGAQQINAWYGHKGDQSFFAHDPRARQNYKDWVDHVLTRTNTITSLAYKDEPAIFGWELMNEPEIEPVSLLRSWIIEMSAYVKSVDPDHLLGVGHGYLYSHFADIALPDIDFGTWHAYPIHWGVSPQAINQEIGKSCRTARSYQKPILLEEFGHGRSNDDQPAVYQMWLDTLHDNPDCAGWVVWRLVSPQDSGNYPRDDYDQFDVHNDGGPVWMILKKAAARMRESSTP